MAGVIVARNFDAGTLVGPGGDPSWPWPTCTLKLEAESPNSTPAA
jgi:hypothetical protein